MFADSSKHNSQNEETLIHSEKDQTDKIYFEASQNAYGSEEEFEEKELVQHTLDYDLKSAQSDQASDKVLEYALKNLVSDLKTMDAGNEGEMQRYYNVLMTCVVSLKNKST